MHEQQGGEQNSLSETARKHQNKTKVFQTAAAVKERCQRHLNHGTTTNHPVTAEHRTRKCYELRSSGSLRIE